MEDSRFEVSGDLTVLGRHYENNEILRLVSEFKEGTYIPYDSWRPTGDIDKTDPAYCTVIKFKDPDGFLLERDFTCPNILIDWVREILEEYPLET